eukprot:TRINITY_DN4012_c0_g1_i2.p1 TRINITY_DN4012_c0_g1~~TRINITY_DN4012_c0_g1_i2.p1  ORF type:complete len:164 (+),score=21.58 TRINITY_DN4012_c0_g1_i2:78-569(+)
MELASLQKLEGNTFFSLCKKVLKCVNDKVEFDPQNEEEEAAVVTLIELLCQSIKFGGNDVDFLNLISEKVDLDEEKKEMIMHFYDSQRQHFKSSILATHSNEKEYKDLHWRMDMQIGSRMLNDNVKATMVMQLETNKDKCEFEADLPALQVEIGIVFGSNSRP